MAAKKLSAKKVFSVSLVVLLVVCSSQINPTVQVQSLTLENQAQIVLINNIKTYEGYNIVVPQTEFFGVPYCWDTYFDTLGVLKFNNALAESNINGEFATQEANGMIPNAPISSSGNISVDADLRSQPPLLADACWQYYIATGDAVSLALWYPKLQAYFNWENIYSNIKGNYLYSPLTGRTVLNDTFTAFFAACSTGMDNLPALDAAGANVTRICNYYYLPMNDLMLSSAMALFAKDMASISLAMGSISNAVVYPSWYTHISNAINTNLWNSTEGRYNNQLWTGQQIQVNTVESFMPMLAGVANKTQGADLVAHLENPAEYNLTFGIPTVAANDPTYYSQEPSYFHSSLPYWRGGIWAPTTYLVYKSLINYGYTATANKIASTWLSVVEETNKFSEYYISTGGAGDSVTDQSWTAAVTLLFFNIHSISTPTP